MPKRKHPNDMCRLNRVMVVEQNKAGNSRKVHLPDGREIWFPNKLIRRLGDPYDGGYCDMAAPRWLLEDREIFEYD